MLSIPPCFHSQLTGAQGEIRYHRQFHHPNLLPLVDSAIQHDNNKGITTVYLLFPFMAGGSLRDVINKRIIDGPSPCFLSLDDLNPKRE